MSLQIIYIEVNDDLTKANPKQKYINGQTNIY